MRRDSKPSRPLTWAALLALLAAPALTLAGPPPVKNVTVLPDKDRAAVMKVMKDWNKALGVKCIACHSKMKEPELDEPEDTEPGRLKKVAREMVTLTEKVNETMAAKNPNFKVSCFSCHRGEAKIPTEPEG